MSQLGWCMRVTPVVAIALVLLNSQMTWRIHDRAI
jgi:hypothetical protein